MVFLSETLNLNTVFLSETLNLITVFLSETLKLIVKCVKKAQKHKRHKGTSTRIFIPMKIYIMITKQNPKHHENHFDPTNNNNHQYVE